MVAQLLQSWVTFWVKGLICLRAVFWALYCSSFILGTFHPCLRMCLLTLQMTPFLLRVSPFLAKDPPLLHHLINIDLVRIDKWCARWGMLIISAKTYSMMISRSRTAWPTFPDLFVGGCIVQMVGGLKILGVVFRDNYIVSRFLSFILPVLE